MPLLAVRSTLPPLQNVVGPLAVIVAVAGAIGTVALPVDEQPRVAVMPSAMLPPAFALKRIDEVPWPFVIEPLVMVQL